MVHLRCAANFGSAMSKGYEVAYFMCCISDIPYGNSGRYEELERMELSCQCEQMQCPQYVAEMCLYGYTTCIIERAKR